METIASWFAASHPGGFIAFSASHRIVLALFVLAVLMLYLLRQHLSHPRRRIAGRFILAMLLIGCELSLNIWYIAQGVFRAKDTLPLELCSISLYLCIIMLLCRSYAAYQIAYFTGIGGALQALLTPVLAYPFPHFRFIVFFLSHALIILSALYMTWVEDMRPTWRSILITMGFLNVLLIIVSGVNALTGGNYMFVARKPETASLLDLLGPYPWYLLSLEAVALVLFVLLYLPFALSDLRRRRQRAISDS